jgi:hypothetical protein
VALRVRVNRLFRRYSRLIEVGSNDAATEAFSLVGQGTFTLVFNCTAGALIGETLASLWNIKVNDTLHIGVSRVALKRLVQLDARL